MRGGTSKGVFVREDDLPPSGPTRDRFVMALMGTPDPMQLDGLGGTHSSTSKLMALSAGTAGHDIDYLFAQVGTDRPIVDYSGNCGNLTAAVAAYAVDEGFVRAREPITEVRMYNKNTRASVLARVPVRAGRARWDGDFVIAGVPGSGAALVTEYLDPAGVKTGALLPTGVPRQVLTTQSGDRVEVSLVDVAGPVVFVSPADLGIEAEIPPAAINADAALLVRLESIRAAAAVLLGLATNTSDAETRSPAAPRLALVDRPRTHRLADGRPIAVSEHDILVRAMSMQRAHHACPLTTAMCVASAARVPDTIAYRAAGGELGDVVRIAHPKGILDVGVRLETTGERLDVQSVSVTRTARRLLEGRAQLPYEPVTG